MTRRPFSILCLCLAAALGPRPALAESPTLVRVSPRGGQRGQELELTLSGSQLKDACELFLYKPGIEVLKLQPAGDQTVKVQIRIAADAPLGEHPLRLRTASGISELRTFQVGLFPTVEEKEPNNDFKTAQKIGLNVTVAGTVTNEDIDTFAVELKKGQRLSAELEGMRLGTAFFDGYLSLFDARHVEIASSDDTALLLQDPLLSIEAPEDGTYYLQVRETTYGGSPDSHYRLHVGTFPRPLAVYPPGGRAGEELEVTYLGDVKGPFRRKLRLPAETHDRLAVYLDDDGQLPPSPNWIRVSDLPNVLEVEPNDTRETATATDLPLPVAFNGIISKPGDEDWFRFRAKKGDTYDVRVYARAVRSPLDPVLEIWKKGGAKIAQSTDQGTIDSSVRFSAPADGEYELRVRDMLRKGGPTFVYRVEFNTPKPSVYAHIPAYDREPRDQIRQWIVVPKGNRFASWIRVNRTGFGGPMTLAFEGLPPGITALSDPVAADVDRVPVVFEAPADATVSGALVKVVARTVDPAPKVEGGFRQDVNLIYGAPNNTVYYGTRVDRLAVAVAEEIPFRLRIEEPKVPIVQSGSMNLRIVAERKEGFTAPIELRLLWTPPGIGAQGTVTLEAGKTEALYPLSANGTAALRTWKTAVIGSAPGANGLAWASTQLTPLTVAAPYVAMKIQTANVEQGKEVDVHCKLEILRPFAGKAKVGLFGLPAGAVAEPAEKEIGKDDPEVVFRVKADPKSPAGQHKSLFGQIVISENGEPIAHSVGSGGILRIDPPRKEGASSRAADAPSTKGK